MPQSLVLAIFVGAALLLILGVVLVLLLVLGSKSHPTRDELDDQHADVLYRALPRGARQFLTAVLQGETVVVLIGPRKAGVGLLLRAFAEVAGDRTRRLRVQRPVDAVTLVSRNASFLAYAEADGIEEGVALLHALLAESSPALSGAELWSAIADRVDLLILARPQGSGPATVVEIAEFAEMVTGSKVPPEPSVERIFVWRDDVEQLAPTGIQPAVLQPMRDAGILLPEHLFVRQP